jgi:translocation and assembly module TamA
MVQVAAGRRVAAALAVAALLSWHGAAAAQQTEGLGDVNAPLDPSAPLDPLPGLGVDWPNMDEQPESEISETPDTSIADTATERSYDVRLEGLETIAVGDLVTRFHQLSTLEANRKDPANAAQIDRRAREDSDLLAELLRANGYYDANVEVDVQAPQADGRVQVTLRAEPGEIYRFSEISLPGLDEAGEDAAAIRAAFGIAPNDPVNSTSVIAGEAAVALELGKRGYAFAEVEAPDIAVDHETRKATLTMRVEPNGTREFGSIVVEGTPLFSARHIQGIARFESGQRYTSAKVEDLRRALIATGIVGSAEVRPVARPNSSVVDIAVKLTPAPVHTIAGEAGYGTGEGIRVEGSWQHRNLIKPEGAVTVRGVLGTREQLFGVILRQNNFLKRDQVLNAQIVASNINQDAYDAHTFQIGANIERQTNIIWQKKWTWSVGGELIATDEKDFDLDTGTTRRRTFFIAAVPATLSYDGSNDLLDPTSGFRLGGRLSPEISFHNRVFGYTRIQLDGSYYQPVSAKVVVAGRARFGTIFGASRDSIAPSRRFYAGGGGSVRGYGYQDLGPRDPVFNDPIGGRSVVEFALEARVRVGNFGIVPFVDAGNIDTASIPDLGHMRFGTGIGVRYHTNFGPIRVDVGTPIGRRKGEPRIAVYVGLGQAF